MNMKTTMMTLVAMMVTLCAMMPNAAVAQYQLEWVGTYDSFTYDDDAAEKVAFDAIQQVALVTNANEGRVDIIALSDPTMPEKIGELDPVGDVEGSNPGFMGDTVQAIETTGNLVFAAVEAEEGPGFLAIYSAVDLSFIGAIPVNSRPDAMSVSKDGNTIAGVSSGDDETPGSVFVLTLDPTVCNPSCDEFLRGGGVGFLSAVANYPVPESIGTVQSLRDAGVRIVDEDAPAYIQLAPEGVAISPDASTVFVNFQENNAMGAVDAVTGEWKWINSYGTNVMTMDPSDRDGDIKIASEWFGVQVKGMHMPDEIDTYEANGKVYVVTANEGSADDVELGEVGTTCASNDQIVDEAVLGRLAVVDSYPVLFDDEGRIICDTITTPSTRSFSVFEISDTGMTEVFDSEGLMEEIVARTNPNFFNSQDDANEFDARSDAKGVEPEGIKIGTMPDGTVLCFISSERISGVFVFDVTDPYNVQFMDYLNRRNFGDVNIEDQVDSGIFTYASLDVGPENFAFIAPEDSPTCKSALLVANPVSGTTTLYNIVEAVGMREGDGHCETDAECDMMYGTPPAFTAATEACSA